MFVVNLSLSPHEEKLKYALEGVSELGTYAASKNLDLLIENHNGYSSDPEWMIALMEGVNQKKCGCVGRFHQLDFGTKSRHLLS